MMTVTVPAPDYEYGGLSSWFRSLSLMRADGTIAALSLRGELTALGRERVEIIEPADVRSGQDGMARVRLEPGERVRVTEAHPDLGENGRYDRWEVAP